MNYQTYDVVVVGSGVGGYPAAVLLAKHGYRVAVVEEGLVGGTCVNRGCVPTKTLLHYVKAAKALARLGLKVETPLQLLLEESKRVSEESRKSVEALLDSAGVVLEKCSGRLVSEDMLACGGRKLGFNRLLLAPGSRPWTPQSFEVDGRVVVHVDDFFGLDSISASKVAIVGGGPAGVELAQALARANVRVDLYEAMSTLLPTLPSEAGRMAKAMLKLEGVNVSVGKPVGKVESNGRTATLCVGGECHQYDMVVCAVGRRPRTSWLANTSIPLNDKGFIAVNERQEAVPGKVYAAGDATGDPMLAHKAIMESLVAAKSILGRAVARPWPIPLVVYTDPQIAYVAHPEKKATRYAKLYWGYGFEARLRGYKPQLVFAKIGVDVEGRIVEALVVGPEASQSIAMLSLAIRLGLRPEEVSAMVAPHPSAVEQVFEAMLEFLGENFNRV